MRDASTASRKIAAMCRLPCKRRFPDARRIRAARRLLDALAGAAGQLARGRPARAARLRRGRDRHRDERARHDGRLGAGTSMRARAAAATHVRVVEISHDDAWMRDVGPTFVVDRRGRGARRRLAVQRLGRHWPAALYFPGTRTTWSRTRCSRSKAASAIARRSSSRAARSTWTAQGTPLVTEECLLNPNRNPTLRRGQIESQLKRYLGVQQVIWLGEGVVDDETDGHVDNLCCFVRPGDVALTWTRRPARSAIRHVAATRSKAAGRPR